MPVEQGGEVVFGGVLGELARDPGVVVAAELRVGVGEPQVGMPGQRLAVGLAAAAGSSCPPHRPEARPRSVGTEAPSWPAPQAPSSRSRG